MDASVRFEFSHGTVWREARWSFVFPTTELNFRTYPHLEGEGHEIPEDFAPALAGKLGYEFPKDVEPSRLALPAYQGGLPSSRRRRIKRSQSLALAHRVAEEVTPEVSRFLGTVLGSPSFEIGELIAEEFRAFRFKRHIRHIERSRKQLEAAGMSPQRVPLRVLAPLLEGGFAGGRRGPFRALGGATRERGRR